MMKRRVCAEYDAEDDEVRKYETIDQMNEEEKEVKDKKSEKQKWKKAICLNAVKAGKVCACMFVCVCVCASICSVAGVYFRVCLCLSQ